MAQTALAAAIREEFGKGSARRARRAGNTPAVVYGHGADPIHITVDNHDFLAIIREEGTNAVISLEIGDDKHLALVKTISQNPLTREIEHVDFLTVKKGEKVEVEVTLVYTGEIAPGATMITESDVLTVLSDALNIPEELTVSIDGMEIGDQLLAGDVTLPEDVELVDDAETLLVNVTFEEVDTESDAEEGDDEDAEADAKDTEEAADE